MRGSDPYSYGLSGELTPLRGLYILLFGFVSLKVKQRWYLGEARMILHPTSKDAILILPVPAFVVGICFGPAGAKLLTVSQWGGDSANETSEIAYVRPPGKYWKRQC